MVTVERRELTKLKTEKDAHCFLVPTEWFSKNCVNETKAGRQMSSFYFCYHSATFIQTMSDHSSLLAATAIGKKEVNGVAPLLKLISLSDSQQPLANQSEGEEVSLYLVTTGDLRQRGLRVRKQTTHLTHSENITWRNNSMASYKLAYMLQIIWYHAQHVSQMKRTPDRLDFISFLALWDGQRRMGSRPQATFCPTQLNALIQLNSVVFYIHTPVSVVSHL